MKKTKKLLILSVLTSICLALTAHASKDQITLDGVESETQKLLHALESWFKDTRDTASEKAKAALEKIDHQISTLEKQIKDKWNAMDESARNKASEQLDQLKKKREAVTGKSESLKDKLKRSAGHLKEGVTNAYDEL